MRSMNARPSRAWAVVSAALLALPLLWGCGDSSPKAAMAPVAEVGVITVKSRPVELTTELPGRTSPFLVAEIRPQVNGILKKRLFVEGSDVQAGQLLYQIDPEPFQVALNSAKASLNKALASQPAVSAKAKRYQSLVAKDSLSHQDYEDALSAARQNQADVDYLRRQVEAAEINLRYTQVTAPISGRIGKSSVTDGALLTAYQAMALATIQQLDPIYVDVTQSSADLLRLRRKLESGQLSADKDKGQSVKVLMEDGSVYATPGRMQFRDVTVDPTTGSYTVRIVVPNPDHLLLPGMFVRAVVLEGKAEEAILVPQQGVTRNSKGEPTALVVDDSGTVQLRILTLNRAIGDQWYVDKGLAPGDRLVIEGMQRVRPGAQVKTVSLDDKAAGQTAGAKQ